MPEYEDKYLNLFWREGRKEGLKTMIQVLDECTINLLLLDVYFDVLY